MAKKKNTNSVFKPIIKATENNSVAIADLNSTVNVENTITDKDQLIIDLNNEKTDLTNKLSQYIEENEQLKAQISEIENLKNEINKLSIDNTNLLAQIAELTFEIAKERNTAKNTTSNNSVKINNKKQSINVSYKQEIKCLNGYNDWI